MGDLQGSSQSDMLVDEECKEEDTVVEVKVRERGSDAAKNELIVPRRR